MEELAGMDLGAMGFPVGMDLSAFGGDIVASAAAAAAIASATGGGGDNGGATSSSGAAGWDGSDHKMNLVNIAQRMVRRQMQPEDIIYQTMQFGQQFQATVTLVCVGGDTYAGEPAFTNAEAEQNAAEVAVGACAEELAKMQSAEENGSMKRKEMATAPSGLPGEKPRGSRRNSWILQQMLMRLLRRPIRPDDVAAQTIQTALGWQSTLAVPGLPEPWQTMAWAGEVAASPKEAEEHAAKHAVDAVRADPLLSQGLGNLSTSNPLVGGGGFVEPAPWQLETSLMQILQRILRPEDFSCTTKQTKLGWQTVIVAPSLPDWCAGKAWAGEVASNGADAEEYAARKALETIRSDAVLLPKLMFNYIRDPDVAEPGPMGMMGKGMLALGGMDPMSLLGSGQLPNLKGGKGFPMLKGAKLGKICCKGGGKQAPPKGCGKKGGAKVGKMPKGKGKGQAWPEPTVDWSQSDWTPPPTAPDWQEAPSEGGDSGGGGGDWQGGW
mmetsp:Transcript_33646/g.96616  ORF Transcript_33646/g.96616 Transcript_33646/m.96616 type:complete len:495 (-) Transcript_33646:125-1609(-)